MLSSDLGPVRYEWRGSFTNQEVNALHAEAFEHRMFEDDWNDQLDRLSLGWVTARDDDGLVDFVNVIWDGLVHASWKTPSSRYVPAGRASVPVSSTSHVRSPRSLGASGSMSTSKTT